ncbi:MAG TPA: VTT domain-containing protein [archaeon]|nr:VTT domain-containing protein [archaeon]
MAADSLGVLAIAWPYVSLFLAGLSSITVLLPTPAFAIAFAAGAAGLNPILIGMSTGMGAAIGEMSTYFVALGSSKLFLKRHKKQIAAVEKKFQEYRPSLVIFVFAATPLPIDVIGLACGALEYPWKKFFLATLAGKMVKFLALGYAGAVGAEWVQNFFQWGA